MVAKTFSSKLFLKLFAQIQIFFILFFVLISIFAIPALKERLYKNHEDSINTVINNLNNHIEAGSYMVDDYLKNAINYQRDSLTNINKVYAAVMQAEREMAAGDYSELQQKQLVLQKLKTISEVSNVSFWVISSNRKFLLHKKESYLGASVDDIVDYYNTPVFKNIISSVNEGNRSGINYYWEKNSASGEVEQITDHYFFDEKWGWILGVEHDASQIAPDIRLKENHFVKQLQNMISEIELFDTSEIYIVDGDYNLVISSNVKEKVKSIAQIWGKEHSKSVKTLLQESEQNKVSKQSFSITNNGAVSVWCKYSPQFDWYVLLAVEETDIFRSVEELNNRIIAFVILLLIVIDFAVVLFVREIVNPLNELSDAAHEVMDGNMDVVSSVDRNDEIGFLGRTFNTMVASINERTTALKEINKQLIDARIGAEKANKSKTKFLTVISHDLLQPINSAKILIATLCNRLSNNNDQAILQQLDNNLDTAVSFIQELVTIAKIDAGNIKPNKQVFPVSELFNELEQEFKVIASDKDIMLRFHKANKKIECDKRLLRHIVQNYLSNAIRYTDDKVLIGCRYKGGDLKKENIAIEVWDNGPGIPKEKLDEIFEEFVRIDTKSRDEAAFGLGLSITTRLSRLMNLKNDVRSKPGVGSIFSVGVPVSSGEITHMDEAVDNAIEQTDLKGKVVLYIDDDINILHAVDIMLSDIGVEMVGVADSDELREVLSDKQLVIDAAIADYNIEEGFTGIDAIKIIKEAKGNSLPVLVVIAETDDEVFEKIKNSGCLSLKKPIERDSLIEWLKENV